MQQRQEKAWVREQTSSFSFSWNKLYTISPMLSVIWLKEMTGWSAIMGLDFGTELTLHSGFKKQRVLLFIKCIIKKYISYFHLIYFFYFHMCNRANFVSGKAIWGLDYYDNMICMYHNYLLTVYFYALMWKLMWKYCICSSSIKQNSYCIKQSCPIV